MSLLKSDWFFLFKLLCNKILDVNPPWFVSRLLLLFPSILPSAFPDVEVSLAGGVFLAQATGKPGLLVKLMVSCANVRYL